MNDWSRPVSDQEAARRAGGRRHYNAHRQFLAVCRRLKLAKLLFDERCSQAEAARRLGVHRSTITRDMQALRSQGRAERACPICGRSIPTWATFETAGLIDDLLGDL